MFISQYGKKLLSGWTLFVLLSALLSCARPLYKFPYHQSVIPNQSRVSFDVNPTPIDSLQILYLGCGHMIITWHGESIMTDPFISAQRFLRTGFGKIQIDRNAYTKFDSIVKTQGADLRSVKSVWVAHAHYDHLLDLPVMLEKQVFDPAVKIYGHEYAGKIMTNFLDRQSFHALQPSETFCPTCPGSPYQWIPAAQNIRIMPIHSNHAAHVKFLFKIHLMKGKLKEKYFSERFTSIDSRTRSKQWREGCTYSFLIDFLDGDSIAFRLFVQTSASDYPLGAPPEEIIRHPVDLAVLCAASTSNVKDYPKKIMDHVGAKKLLFIHWEDFFRQSLEFNDPRLVRLTNYKKVARRLKQWNPDVVGTTLMPRPGTLVRVGY